MKKGVVLNGGGEGRKIYEKEIRRLVERTGSENVDQKVKKWENFIRGREGWVVHVSASD